MPVGKTASGDFEDGRFVPIPWCVVDDIDECLSLAVSSPGRFDQRAVECIVLIVQVVNRPMSRYI